MCVYARGVCVCVDREMSVRLTLKHCSIVLSVRVSNALFVFYYHFARINDGGFACVNLLVL